MAVAAILCLQRPPAPDGCLLPIGDLRCMAASRQGLLALKGQPAVAVLHAGPISRRPSTTSWRRCLWPCLASRLINKEATSGGLCRRARQVYKPCTLACLCGSAPGVALLWPRRGALCAHQGGAPEAAERACAPRHWQQMSALPKRIIKETERLLSEPVPGILAVAHEENLRYFDVAMDGPVDSPYQSKLRAAI